jgi:hypothetical protein
MRDLRLHPLCRSTVGFDRLFDQIERSSCWKTRKAIIEVAAGERDPHRICDLVLLALQKSGERSA